MSELTIAILDRWLRRFYKDQINPTKAHKDETDPADAMTLTKHHAQTGYPWTKTVGPPHSSGDAPGQNWYVLRSNDLIQGPPAPWWHWRRWWRR